MELLNKLIYDKIPASKAKIVIEIPVGTTLYEIYKDLGKIPGSGYKTVTNIRIELEQD